MEPTEFDPKWWSHKFNGPGLRYEIGISIRSGDIAWVARNALIDALLPEERVVADKGYNDPNYFDVPIGNADHQKRQILARHETVNHRIKKFCCMNNRFRHKLYLHHLFFHAVINLNQLMIENGEPLFVIDV